MDKMNYKRNIIVTVIVVGLVLILGFIVWTLELYPIITINRSHMIMKFEYRKTTEIASKYLSNQSTIALEEKSLLSKMALDQLIDDVLINEKLKEDFSQSEINNKINARATEYFSDKDIIQWIEKNNISKSDISKYLIAPVVKNELIYAKFGSESELINWLSQTRKETKIRIFIPNTKWLGEKGIEFEK